MINFLIMIVGIGGMLAVGWFVWRGLESQEATSADENVDHKPDIDDDTTANE